MLDRMGRSIKDSILNPLERAIPPGLSPNTITWISFLPGMLAAVCAAAGLWGWALAAFAVNRLLDGLDGVVARRRGRQTDYGGYLDIMVDFTVYAAIPIGVWLGSSAAAAGEGTAATGPPEVLPLITLLAVFYINAASWMYLSAVIEKRRVLGGDQRRGSADAGSDEAGSDDTGRDDTGRDDTGSAHAAGGAHLTSVTMPTGVVEGTETILFFALFLLLPDHYALLFWIMSVATAAGVLQRLLWARRALR